MRSSVPFQPCMVPLKPMRSLLILALCGVLVMIGCRKRKVEPTAPAETVKQPEAAQVPPPAPSAPAQASAKKAAPVTIPQVEAGVEFGDLNNIISGFEYTHKRLPTADELKKLYYGGTRPIPVPRGYKLIVDPKSKRAKLVPGS